MNEAIVEVADLAGFVFFFRYNFHDCPLKEIFNVVIKISSRPE